MGGGSAYHKALTQDNRQKLVIDPFVPLGFELTIPVFMLSKTKHPFRHVATEWLYLFIYLVVLVAPDIFVCH